MVGPELVKSELSLNLDITNSKSYNTGSGWNNLSGSINATLFNDPTVTNSDSLIKSLQFDGANDYIELDNDFAAGKSELSICTWILHNSSSDDWIYVERTEESGTGQFQVSTSEWMHRDNSTGIYAGTSITDINKITYTIPQGVWTHLALVYSVSGGFKRAYIDGELVDEKTESIDVLTSTRNGDIKPLIGTRRFFNHFEGEIPIFQIYDKALTEQEVKQNYNAQKGRYKNFSEISGYDFKIDAGDLNSYPGSGTIVTDLGPNSITSTITGALYSNEGGGSFYFDGQNDIIKTDITNYDLTNTSFTVDAWFKFVNPITEGRYAFIGGGVSSANQAWNLGIVQFASGVTQLDLDIFNDGSGGSFDPNEINLQDWNYFAVNYNSQTGESSQFLNGLLLDTGTTGALLNSSMQLEIGAVIYGGQKSYYQEGYLASTRIWKRTLSLGEISLMYNSEKSRFGL